MAEFEINNEIEANRILKKIKELREEKSQWQDHYKDCIAKSDAEFDGKIGYYMVALAKYFERPEVVKRETKTSFKLKLLDGEIIFKKPTQKYEYDVNTLLQYLKDADMNEYVNSKESVDWASLKKSLTFDDSGNVINTDTGEIIDVITLEDVQGSFDVR